MNELTPIPQLKTEIQFYEQQTATGMLEIGKRLIQIKEQLPHGEFGPWCERELSYDQRTANRFMKSFHEFGNSTTLSNLRPSQMFELLGLPEETKQEIVKTNDMESITIKELREEVKKYKSKTQELEESNQKFVRATQELSEQLEQRPEPEVIEKVIEKEVVPEDYEKTKKDLEDYKRWSKEHDKKYNELQDKLWAVEKQQKDRECKRGHLDPWAFAGLLNSFLGDFKRYEAMEDDFKELEEKELNSLLKGMDRIMDEITAFKFKIQNLEVIDIE